MPGPGQELELRLDKNRALHWNEADGNFTYLYGLITSSQLYINALNNFSASVTRDSASFDFRINSISASFNSYIVNLNIFTQSVTRDSASFDARINAISSSIPSGIAGFVTTSSFNNYTASYTTLTGTTSSATTQSRIYNPTDIQGALFKIPSVPAGESIDNIDYFTINGETYRRQVNGIRRATELGLQPGSDITTRLNTVMSSSKVSELIFDLPEGGVFTINSTVNFRGKKITFSSDNRLTGSGQINNAILDADYNQEIISPSLNYTNLRSAFGEFSNKWFGVKSDGITDDTVAWNKAGTAVAQSPQKTLRVVGSQTSGSLINSGNFVALPLTVVLNIDNTGYPVFIGSGSFQGGIINAVYNQQLFDLPLTVGFFKIVPEYYEVMWFGAKGTAIVDDYPALQKSIDFNVAAANGEKVKFHVPHGIYNVSQPLMVYRWNGTQYIQCSAFFEGDRSQQHGISGRTLIKASGSDMGDKFVLGIQIGSQTHFNNIAFQNLYTQSQAIFGGDGFRNMVNAEYNDWSQPGIRDSQWSPNACVVVDPFWGTVPTDGGYPGMTSWYRGLNNSGGSSNIEFNGCWFSNSLVGTIVGLAQTYGQSEYIRFHNCSWENHKVGYNVCNSQANDCIIYNFECTSPMYTFVDNCSYGNVGGSPPIVKGGVAAAGLMQFCNIVSVSKPLMVHNVFAETIYRIGAFNSLSGGYYAISNFLNCTFNLFRYDEVRSPDWIVLGKANFTGCNIICVESGNSKPYRLKFGTINTDPVFNEGLISQVITKWPNVENNPFGKSAYQSQACPTFFNTMFYLPRGNIQINKIGVQNKRNDTTTALNPLGINKIRWSEVPGVNYQMEWNEPFMDETIFLESNNTTFNSNYKGESSILLSSASVSKVKVNDILTSDLNAGFRLQVLMSVSSSTPSAQIDQIPVLGLVSAISGTLVYMNGSSRSIPTGSYTGSINVYLNYTRFQGEMCVCDITSGSNILTNFEKYVPTDSGVFGFPGVGTRFEHFAIEPGAYVSESSAGSKTVTLTLPAKQTVTNATLINGSPEIKVESIYSPASSSVLAQPPFYINGMRWKEFTKDTGSIECVNEYIIGNTAFKNTKNAAATRVLDISKITTIVQR